MLALTREQVRAVDRIATARFGVPSIVLMENAGRGATDHLLSTFSGAHGFTVVAGRGNNGGDGFVIARHLHLRGHKVRVTLVGPRDGFGLAPDAATNLSILERLGLPLQPILKGTQLAAELRSHPVVVDAILGTGISGEVRGLAREAIDALNESGCPIFAVDIPSGLDCDAGRPLGAAVRASHTATFAAMKTGFLLQGADAWTGAVHIVDIGCPVVFA